MVSQPSQAPVLNEYEVKLFYTRLKNALQGSGNHCSCLVMFQSVTLPAAIYQDLAAYHGGGLPQANLASWRL